MFRPEKPAPLRFVLSGLVFLLPILVGLACNYPQRTSLPNSLPGEALRQTLSVVEGAPVDPAAEITPSPESSSPVSTGIAAPAPSVGYFEYLTRPGDTLASSPGTLRYANRTNPGCAGIAGNRLFDQRCSANHSRHSERGGQPDARQPSTARQRSAQLAHVYRLRCQAVRE